VQGEIEAGGTTGYEPVKKERIEKESGERHSERKLLVQNWRLCREQNTLNQAATLGAPHSILNKRESDVVLSCDQVR
jgi:hypothetical protein